MRRLSLLTPSLVFAFAATPGTAFGLLSDAVDVETPCADVPARNCSAVGQATWSIGHSTSSVSEFTGDWQWQVSNANLTGGDLINDLQVVAGRHPQVHPGELLGSLLTINFFNIAFAAQPAQTVSMQHIGGGGHFDTLRAAVVANLAEPGQFLVTINLNHDPAPGAIPEPRGVLLLGLGLATIGLMRYRRLRS